MYDSEIPSGELISELLAEITPNPPPARADLLRRISACERLLYQKIATFERRQKIPASSLGEEGKSLPLAHLVPGKEEAPARGEDILFLFADGREIPKFSAKEASEFPPEGEGFLPEEDSLTLFLKGNPQSLEVVWRVLPARKKQESETIKLPLEWLCIPLALIRGHLCRLCGDGERASLWLEEYNASLSSFKEWCQDKRRR